MARARSRATWRFRTDLPRSVLRRCLRASPRGSLVAADPMAAIFSGIEDWRGALERLEGTCEDEGASPDTMRNSIAVMNTKGGVGKSTLVLALAETLVGLPRQERARDRQRRAGERVQHADDGVEPVQAAERRRDHRRLSARDRAQGRDGRMAEVHRAQRLRRRRRAHRLSCCRATCSSRCSSARCRRRACTRACATVIAELLAGVRKVFDIVLIDCPPGLSVLTESWLREADFHVSPTKADYVSVCGLEVFRRFKALNPEMGFAENLGVIVNMKELNSAVRRGISPLARGQRREPLLQAGGPAHVGAAGCGELPDLRPQLSGQVSRRRPAPPCER